MGALTRYINFSSGEVISFSTMFNDHYISNTEDVNTIIEQIQNNSVSSVYRIFVLYDDETINYEIPKENIKLGGSYNENYQNGQRRTLSFTLYNYDGAYTPNINVLTPNTRLRLDMGVELDNETTIWFTKGVFIVNSVNVSHTSTGSEAAISAGDKYSIFESNLGQLTSTYEVPVNTPIMDVITTILHTDMGNGIPFDQQPVIMHTSLRGKTTQSTISKETGDNFGAILTELATQMSAEIFYNSNGNLTIMPITEVSDDGNKPLLFSYNTDTDSFSQLAFNVDYNQLINRVVVIGNTSNGNVYQAIAVNDDPASPFCYQRVGYRTGAVIRDSNITSNILAQERADYELRQKIIVKSAVNINVLFNPLLEVNNLISITDDFFDLAKARFIIQGISCSLDYNNQMSISMSNINNLPFLAK